MEATELHSDQKAQTLLRLFHHKFYTLTYTIHPASLPNEIRGKSSNVSYAAAQMARLTGGGIPGRHMHELVTIIDADTCFAEDYFTAVTYHYSLATPSQRSLLFFAPPTVFDRNANEVPLFVRVTDMFWSIGVLSNLYPSSPIKIPCSAYTLPMTLAISVNFWDTGPEAIGLFVYQVLMRGEDMHQYLKCFFRTSGRLLVKTIYSPASQCNIEGTGSGVSGYISGILLILLLLMQGMHARFTQAKRHLWGSLDTGYTLRHLLLTFLSPQLIPTVSLKPSRAASISTLFTLLHRMLEAHVIMGQLFTMITLSTLIFPLPGSFLYSRTAYIWSFLSSTPPSHYILLAVEICFWVRLFSILPNVFMIIYYEKYLQWTGFERWALQSLYSSSNESEMKVLKERYPGAFVASEQNLHLKVFPLGKRASLASPRTYPYCLLDWIGIPVSGFLFYVLPQWVAQITHLYSTSLEYKVAAKPKIGRGDAQMGRDEGFFEEDESRVQSPSMSRSNSGIE